MRALLEFSQCRWLPQGMILLLIYSTIGISLGAGDNCSEFFPRLIVERQAQPFYYNDAVELYMDNKSCQPVVVNKIDKPFNVGLAAHAQSATFCARPKSSDKFSCWNDSRRFIDEHDGLPGPVVGANYKMVLDSYGRNLYWTQSKTTGHLYVTNLLTKASKVVVSKAGEVSMLAVDTEHGMIFWVLDKGIYEARIERPVRGTPSEIITSVTFINGMTIDTQNQYLYWRLDNVFKRKHYFKQDIEQRILDLGSDYVMYNTMTYFHGFLYFIVGGQEDGYFLIKFNWETKQQVEFDIGLKNDVVRGMLIYEVDSQLPANPCDALQCTHICLPEYPGGRSQCLCPSYMSWNGTTCVTYPIFILAGLESNLWRGDVTVENLLLFTPKVSEIGPENEETIELANIIDASAGIQVIVNSTACFKVQSYQNSIRCFNTDNLYNSTAAPTAFDGCTRFESQLSQLLAVSETASRVTSTNTDGRNGFVFSLDQQQCVHILNVGSGNIWKAYCVPYNEMDTRYVDIDPTNFDLYYRHRNRGFFKVSLQTMESEALQFSEPDTPPRRKLFNQGSLLCHDVVHQRLMWVSGTGIKWASISSKGDTFKIYSSPNATSVIKKLSCIKARSCFIELDHDGRASILTMDNDLLVIESNDEVHADRRILDFKLVHNYDSGYSKPCESLNCSHGCVTRGATPLRTLCFCPNDMILDTMQNNTCQSANERSVAEKKVIDVSSFSDSESWNGSSCTEYFPRILVQVNIRQGLNKAVQIQTDNCRVDINGEIATATNLGMAVDSTRGILCGRHEIRLLRLICWVPSRRNLNIILRHDVLPGPVRDFDVDYLLHFDPEQQNLYWKSVETDSNLYVTSIVTKMSKVVLEKPGNLLRMTVDTDNGIIFWANDQKLFQAPIGRLGHAISTEIQTPKEGKAVVGLTADTLSKHLYWCKDHVTVYRKPYDDVSVEKHELGVGAHGGIRSNTMHYFDGFLYFIRGEHDVGHILSKFRWETKQEIQFNLGMRNLNVTAMEIYERHNSTVENPCEALNCTHLCLPLHGQGAQCACPSYMKWNGSACTTNAMIIIKQIGGKRGFEPVRIVLFKQNEDEIGFEKGQLIKLSPTANQSSRIETAINAEVCIKNQVDGNASCLCIEDGNEPMSPCSRNDSSPLQSLLERGFENALEQYRIVHVHSDGIRGYLFALDLQQLCVYVLNVATSNIWKAFCAPDIVTVEGYVAIDPERMLIFYRNTGSQLLRKASLSTQECDDLAQFEDVAQSTASMGDRMCTASGSETIFWVSSKTIKWVSYGGGEVKVLQEGSIKQETIATKQVLQIRCSSSRAFWIKIDNDQMYTIVTVEPNLIITEKLHSAAKNEKILDFRFSTNLGSAGANEDKCFSQNCSHGCLRDGVDSNPRCFCPPHLVLMDRYKCSPPTVIAITDRDGGIFEVLESEDFEYKMDPDEYRTVAEYLNLVTIPMIRNTSTVPLSVQFDFVLTKNINAVCWLNNLKLYCRFYPQQEQLIGHMTAENPVFALNLEGTEIIWNTNETGRFRVTKLETNESLSFSDFPIQVDSPSLVAVDTRKAIVFWCDNVQQVIRSKLLLSADPSSKVLYPWSRLPSSSASAKCTGIANDLYNERIFVIYRENIIMLSYASYRSVTTAEAIQVSNLKYEGGTNLVYQNQVLYWISDKGALQYLTVPHDLVTDRSLTPSVLRSNATIRFAKTLHYNFEGVENEFCTLEKCPVFCFPINSASTFLSEPSCQCPDGETFIIGSRVCEKHISKITSVFVVVLILLASLLVLVLFVYSWWRMKRGKRRQSEELFLTVNPSYSCDENSPLYEETPFTKVIAAEHLVVDKSHVLGKGNFGVVYSGLVDGNLVAVKTLQAGFDTELLMEFAKGLKIMADVGEHENVVRFLGADISRVQQGVIWAVLEMSPEGCLAAVLRRYRLASEGSSLPPVLSFKQSGEPSEHTNASETERDEGMKQTKELPLAVLVYWTRQIANGMAFLESKNVVHGNLAARNVLVFPNHVVKISDFGYSKNLYQNSSYLKKKQVALPWRWSAPETLEMMEFSTKSDVWAFGVTAWEIFSLGNVPFPQMVCDEQFMAQLKQGLRLQKPDLMPEDLYENLLIISWNLNPDKRPTFTELCDRIDQMYGSLISKVSDVEYDIVSVSSPDHD